SSAVFAHSSPTPLSPLSLHDALPISKVLATFGRIDIAACFAGHRFRVEEWNKEFTDLTPAEFRGPLDVDLLGSAYVARRSTSRGDRKSTRLNSSHQIISYAVFCLTKK